MHEASERCAAVALLVAAMATAGCSTTADRQSGWLAKQFPEGTTERELEERAVELRVADVKGDRKEYRAIVSRPCFVCSSWREFVYSNQLIEGRFVFIGGRLLSVERVPDE